MSNVVAIILAILAPSGVIVTLLEKTRKENNRDHNSNRELLEQIDVKVDGIDNRLDHHIEWHLDKESK
jgi:hypothetical protein